MKWSSSVKYLGVHLNSRLTWNNHCAFVAAKATKLLNLLRRHLFVYSPVVKCRAFRSLVIPILEYASEVWNPHTQKNICQLEAIQLRAARWVCGSRFNHLTFKWSKSSSQCRSELNWPELSTRRKYLSLLTVHDILHKRTALRFSDYFTFSSLCTQSHSPCIADLQPLTHLDTLFLLTTCFCGIRSVTQLCLSLIVICSKPSCISS